MKAVIKITILSLSFLSKKSLAQAQQISSRVALENKYFLDVHHIGKGKVTTGAVATAHQKDLQIQNKYGVQFIKYWVDTAKGDVYCLSVAPDSNAITKTHAESHGLIPDEVFAVHEGIEAAMQGGKNLYLDIHDLGIGNVTSDAVVLAHKKDLAVQRKYQVNFINYWVDEKKGKIFCLSEASSKANVIQTHKEAHGLLPNEVLTVNQGQ